MKNLNLFTWLLECSGNAATIGLIPCQLRQQDGKNTAKTRQKDGKSSIYRRIITLLTLLLTLGVGQMWGEVNCSLGQAYLRCNFNGSAHEFSPGNAEYTYNTSSHSTYDLGTLSTGSFTITYLSWHCWNNWGSDEKTENFFWYYVNSGATTTRKQDWNGHGDFYPKQENLTITIANATDASGEYTFNHGWYTKFYEYNSSNYTQKDLNNSGSFKFKYTILPPAVSGFGVSTSGHISGAGTSGNPYVIPYNGTLTLTVSGSKGRTDDNSTIKYWKNSGDKQNSNVLTVTGITSSDLQSVVVHAQCINNSDANLVGTEGNATIYYKAGYTITPVAKYTTDGSTYTTGTTGGTVTINGSSSAIGVVKDATYSIVATPASGYCVEEIKVGDAVAWEQANDNNRQTAAKTISTYTATADKTVTVKFARIQNITLHIHDGGVGGLVLQNATPKVGAHTVSLPNTTLTSEGNGWYYHTFDNVTSVTVLNVACSNTGAAAVANAGQPISTYTLSQTEYFSAIHSQNDGSSSICYVLGVSYTNQSYSIGSPAITLNPTYTLAPSGSPTYSWSVTSQPDGGAYSLSATNVASPTFSSTVEGTYTLRVQVTTEGCTKSTSFNVEVANGVPDPEISGATFVTNPILSNAHLQISITYANIPAEGCYIRLKQGAGYWNDENNSAWTALSSGSGSMTFTTNNTNVPTGTWTIELYNNAKNSLLSSTNVTGSLSVLTAQTITISAGANGSVSPTTVYAGSGYRSESFTATPNDHYQFVNWSNNNSSNVTVNDVNSATTYVSTAAAAATITANFAGDQYSITYKDQGNKTFTGTQAGAPTTHTYGTATNLIMPTRTGYDFAGWFTASNCESGAVGNTTSASLGATAYTSNITLYAKWTEKMTTVTVNVNPAGAGTLTVGGGAFTPGSTTTAGVTTSRTVVAAANSGNVFLDWSVSGNATGSASTNTYTLNGNGSAGAGTLTANFGVSTGWYLEGTDFGGWGGDNCSSLPTTYPFSRPYRDQANTYYIPVTLNSSRYFKVHKGDGCSNVYNFGSNSDNVTISKNTIYNLTADATNSGTVTSTMSNVWAVLNTSTKKFWVQDSKTYYTVTLANGSSGNTNNGAAGTEGTVTLKTNDLGNLQTKQYASGETIKIAISAKSGYYIDDITIGGNSVITDVNAALYNGTTTMPAGDATLTVTYKHNYTVTYGVGTSYTSMGSVSSSPAHTSGQRVIEGTSMTFTATPNLGYKFVGWYSTSACSGDAVSTNAEYNTTIAGTTTLYAKFALLDLYIHADFVSDWGTPAQMMHSAVNPAVYTYTIEALAVKPSGQVGEAWDNGHHFHFVYTTADPNNHIAYNYDGVQTPTYSGSSIDGVHKTHNINPTIEFGLTRKSYVTITLTLQAAPAKPTVSISADPIYTITIAKSGPDAGFASLSPSAGSTVEARASVASSAVIVGVNTGYTRTDWTATSGITITSASSNSTTVTATADGTLTANVRPNTYTVAFNANDDNYVGEATGTTAPIENKAYNAGSYTLTANGFSRTGYTFAGWNTNADGTSGTNYSDEQSITSPLTAEDGETITLYAKWTGLTYTVTFNARGGSSLSASSTTVTMGATYGEGTDLSGEMPTVTAPTGYVFDGWYTASVGGTKVTKTTQVTTASDHTLYAHYVQKAQVYFKNTLGWDKVYVVYDANWDGTQGTGSQSKTYREMTLVPGTTDVYYDDIPDEYISSWRWNIAFNNTYQTNHYAFTSGEAVFRHDFDKKATMFVPTNKTGSTEDGNFVKNSPAVQYRSTGYADGTGDNPQYTSGYWRTYNNTYSGYTMTYQKNGGSWSSGHKMECAKVGDNVFVYTVHMDANSQYNFAFYKERDVNTKSVQFNYRTQITSSACTDLKLVCNPNNAWMQTTVEGDYVFKLRLEDDGHMYLTVEYPFAVNDYRVRYSYTKGSAQNNYSEIIRAAANGLDTISVFIHSGDSATARSLTIEQCTAINNSGVATWNTSYATITLPSETASGKTSGVYNFIITQDGSAAASGAYWNKYTGNYYIRTECSDGKWDMYEYRPDNIMTLSEYSLTQTLSAPYSHYYCRYVESTDIDITYAVATDYSPNISGIMVGDATIGGDGNKTLPASANVRFTWNQETNALRRAYLKNAQGEGNSRFLVLHGDDKIFNASTGAAIMPDGDRSLDASELLFSDLGNWIYQVELQAYPSATVKLIAQYNGSDRYLVGDAGHSMTIMGGTPASTKYAITAVYDFKTNRLMTVWTPSGAIGDALVDVDILLVRHKQEDATSVTFNPGGSLTTKKVYGAIRLDYDELVGHVASWTTESRPLLKYMISFPFDVNISDIFGLNTRYGEAYIIQKYDGADRAARGFFRGDGTTTFWKDMEQNEVMRANVGYCVIFDNDYLNGDLGAIWENKSAESSVYLYFPSAGNVGAISNSTKDIEVTALPCNIDREFTVGVGTTRTLNHKYTDSNWNLIGVPIFQNSTGALDPATIASENTGNQTGSYGPFYYFYDYDVANNRYSIASAAGYNFKTMYSYMLQYAGTVTFTGSTPSSVAARRIADTKKYEVELQVLNNDEEVINRAFVNLKENACDTFALNEDVYMSPNSAAVNIYTLAGNYDVAANILSIDNHIVPVGVEVSKAGNYSFSMPSDFDGTVVLVDNFDGSRTDLSLGDYSVALPKGTIEDRFTLEINIERSSATDIEGIEGGNIKDGKAHKFVRDGIMYILRDGVIYDAMGKRVK